MSHAVVNPFQAERDEFRRDGLMESCIHVSLSWTPLPPPPSHTADPPQHTQLTPPPAQHYIVTCHGWGALGLYTDEAHLLYYLLIEGQWTSMCRAAFHNYKALCPQSRDKGRLLCLILIQTDTEQQL